jgi:hypothetical protein
MTITSKGDVITSDSRNTTTIWRPLTTNGSLHLWAVQHVVHAPAGTMCMYAGPLYRYFAPLYFGFAQRPTNR